MVTIVLDGRYLVLIGIVLNLVGLYFVMMADQVYVEDDPGHYMLYLIPVLATVLIMCGIVAIW